MNMGEVKALRDKKAELHALAQDVDKMEAVAKAMATVNEVYQHIYDVFVHEIVDSIVSGEGPTLSINIEELFGGDMAFGGIDDNSRLEYDFEFVLFARAGNKRPYRTFAKVCETDEAMKQYLLALDRDKITLGRSIRLAFTRLLMNLEKLGFEFVGENVFEIADGVYGLADIIVLFDNVEDDVELFPSQTVSKPCGFSVEISAVRERVNALEHADEF